MFLSKIELIGFKSFANKTVFKFNGGITAIVGPNGCGKTNIVDAVRWVLGEQKTSILRSELMENVIFNGSSTRKPLGMAEVSITFLNDKQIIPGHFSEITITRRLFRDGESVYLLNNTSCRLKDITDLLMDTGIGANSYSVIELKMIESLLNGNFDERRRLLEEAAGISKFKSRKKETTKKLSTVHDDLLRIYDITAEIEKQVNSLSRQASKTRRYNKLHNQLKQLEVSLWKKEFESIKESLKLIDVENTRLQNTREELQLNLQSIVSEISSFEQQIDNLSEQIQELQVRESELFRKFSSLKQSIAVNNEKINSLDSSLKKLAADHFDAENLMRKYNQTLAKLESLKSQKENELSSLEATFSLLQSDYEKILSDIINQRKQLEADREKIVHTENQIQFLRLQIEQLETTSSKNKESEEQIASEIVSLLKQIENEENSKAILENEIRELEVKIQQEYEEAEKLKGLESALNQQIDLLKEKINEKNLELKEISTSLEFLSSLLEVDESTRFLLNSSDWQFSAEPLLLGEILGIDESLRVAYDSLLGEYKNILILEKNEDVSKAVALLQEKRKGKCFFAVLENINGSFEPPKFDLPNNVIGFASELPKVDLPIRFLLRILLGNAVIVNDFQTANEIAKDAKFSKVVTLSGEIIYKGLVQKRGTVLGSEGLSIGKVERIAKLKSIKQKIEEEIQAISSNLNILSENLKSIMLKRNYNNSKLKNYENEKAKFHDQLNKLESKLSSLYLQKESMQKDLGSIKESYNQFFDKLDLLNKQLADSEIELQKLKDKYKENYNKFEIVQNQNNDTLTNLRQIEKNVVELRMELKNIQGEMTRISSSKDKLQQKLLQIQKETEESKRIIEKLKNLIATISVDIQAINSELEEVKNSRLLFEEKKEELELLLQSQIEHRDMIQKQIDKIVAQIHQNELRRVHLTENNNSIFEKALETYDVNLNDISLPDDIEEINPENARIEIDRIRQALFSLGEINFLALQEFNEQNERLDFYRKQIEDLKNSEKSLKEALTELNQNAKQKFIDTFEKVNKNFQKVFNQLFDGDSFAEIIIDRDDVLECDIEIKAKPPGKRMLSIDALSQGEKTLTALSFLFALYLVKPSPFCILDEVDAPLDDANVERYIHLLNSFSKDIQFILITHNKRTMEAADCLYGITMAEDGVSKVLSVKLVE